MVGEELREAGYCNVDGLDPSQGYLNGAVARGIFRHVFRAFIDPDSPVSAISDNSYDALLCCAGFFQVETLFFKTLFLTSICLIPTSILLLLCADR